MTRWLEILDEYEFSALVNLDHVIRVVQCHGRPDASVCDLVLVDGSTERCPYPFAVVARAIGYGKQLKRVLGPDPICPKCEGKGVTGGVNPNGTPESCSCVWEGHGE